MHMQYQKWVKVKFQRPKKNNEKSSTAIYVYICTITVHICITTKGKVLEVKTE